MSSELRRRVIRLAASNPELRKDLLTILKEEADPTSHDQNLPETWYGLPPQGPGKTAGAAKVAAKKMTPFAEAYFKLWRDKAGMGDMDDIEDMEKDYVEGKVTDQELFDGAPKSWKKKLPPLK
jgi:hypothetical protein